MQGYQLALCYDSKEEHLAAGLSREAVAEFDAEDTIDLLAGVMEDLGHKVERVRGGRRLARLFALGWRWDLVFNIAEGLRGRSRESQVPALCELFDQPFTFSDAASCALTLDKEVAKRVVRDSGLPTPSFGVAAGVGCTIGFKEAAGLSMPLFVKPLAEGNSKGVTPRSLILRREELPAVCCELQAAYSQPVLIEEFLPGRELTVGIVGNGSEARVLGVMEIGFQDALEPAGYTAANKRRFKQKLSFRLTEDVELAREAGAISLAIFGLLGCRDAARIDLRCDGAGKPCFLEVNALPGLHPSLSDLPRIGLLAGISYTELLRQILDAAAKRVGSAEKRQAFP